MFCCLPLLPMASQHPLVTDWAWHWFCLQICSKLIEAADASISESFFSRSCRNCLMHGRFGQPMSSSSLPIPTLMKTHPLSPKKIYSFKRIHYRPQTSTIVAYHHPGQAYHPTKCCLLMTFLDVPDHGVSSQYNSMGHGHGWFRLVIFLSKSRHCAIFPNKNLLNSG